MMDIAKSFTFMFEDPDWLRKLGVGILVILLGFVLLVVLIGIVPLLMVAGYGPVALRNVMDGQEHPLPEWDNFGGFLGLGFKLAAALFVWALPAIAFSLPLGIGSALLSNSQTSGANAGGITLVVCSSCLVILWSLLIVLFTPAIYIRLARTGRFGSAFAFGKLWELTRANLGKVIVALVLVWLAGLIASFIAPFGALLIIIGLFVTVPLAILWQLLVQAHLFGQVGAASTVSVE
jgi:hypothetical protein